MNKERVVISGIGLSDETYRTKHTYTMEQAKEIRELIVMMYRAAWEDAGVGHWKVTATPLAGGEVVDG